MLGMEKTQKKRKANGNGRGRPPKAAEDLRNVLLRIMVTREEAGEIRAAAERSGVSLSTWVRLAALAAARQNG